MNKFLRKYWPAFVALLLINLSVQYFNKSPLTDSAFSRQLDGILPPKGVDFNFSDTILHLTALVDPAVNIDKTNERLDIMAEQLSRIIDNAADPEIVSEAMNTYFFKKMGYAYDYYSYENYNKDSKGNFGLNSELVLNAYSIPRVIERHRGVCISLSMVFLMMGEKLGLPLHGVVIPGHFFVRYKEPGRPGVNIETTYKGIERYDYEESSGIEFLDKNKTLLGREMDKYESLGVYLATLSFMAMSRGEMAKAVEFSKKSIEMVEKYPEPYQRLAWIYEIRNRREDALRLYEKAYETNPNEAYTNAALGRIYFGQGRYTKAEKYLAYAVKKNEKDINSLNMLSRIKGRYEHD